MATGTAEAEGMHKPVAGTILITGMNEDEIRVNMTRINGTDLTKPENYTRCEMAAMKLIYEEEAFLKKFVHGFEDAFIDKVAPFTGIREIVGKYVLICTKEGVKPADVNTDELREELRKEGAFLR